MVALGLGVAWYDQGRTRPIKRCATIILMFPSTTLHSVVEVLSKQLAECMKTKQGSLVLLAQCDGML